LDSMPSSRAALKISSVMGNPFSYTREQGIAESVASRIQTRSTRHFTKSCMQSVAESYPTLPHPTVGAGSGHVR
jgi:hypothetical protein